MRRGALRAACASVLLAAAALKIHQTITAPSTGPFGLTLLLIWLWQTYVARK